MKKVNLKENVNKIKKKINKQEEIDKKIKKQHHVILINAILVIIIVSLILGLSFMLYIIASAPEFDTDKLYSEEASILYLKDGTEFARIGPQNRELVSYDELPQVLVDAIVATEDSRFFQHNGFDIARFMKASLGQIAGRNAGGASTLTMQVVKNTFTSRNARGLSGIIRKFTDIYMAIFKVEKNYTKEEIIEFYVNDPWLGANNAWGVEQACQTYFGKSVKDISLPEAALIAGIFNAPDTLSPFNSIENATERRDTVLNLMYRHGYISEEQLNDAKSISVASLIVENKGNTLNKYQSFIDTVANEVKKDTGMDPYNGGMKIYTTLDASVQDALIEMNEGKYYKWKNDYEQVAVAVTSIEDGSVVAISGRRNQTTERASNLATKVFAHPGSTAKPIFDYGPLIEYENASPGTYFFDEPMTYSNGQPLKNSEGSYNGIMTMRTALSTSRNIPAVQAFQQVDNDKIADFAHSLGIDYGDILYESCAVGGFDAVSVLQMAAAYSAFGRGGYYIEPYTYTKIIFSDSNEEIEKKPKKEKVMSESTAYMITSILMTAAQNGAGGNFSISGTDVAAKTGTSTYDGERLKALGINEASRDNWNITYSPDYTISLWYGYEELNKDHYTKSLTAAGVRKKLMAGIAKQIYKKNSRFEVPSSVVKVEVEKETVPLQLPSEYTPEDMRMTEVFKAGTEPTETSIRYQKLDVPTNGKAETDNNTITISWDAITTPQAIDQTALQTYFTEYYKDYAEKYYNRRLTYNNTSIGYLGYQVYLQTSTSLVPLGFTDKTSYTYQMDGASEYTFVVKSAYSIFKNNMSDGLTIKAVGNGSSDITIKLEGKQEVCKQTGNGFYNDPYQSNPVKALDINGNDLTSKLKLTKTIITNYETNEEITEIPLNVSGKYKITYYLSYNNKEYNVERIINVSDACPE